MSDAHSPDEPTLSSETVTDDRGGPRTLPSQDGPSFPASALPRIDGYEVTGRLGEGGMGTVWRAVQLSTKREVALKLMGAAAIGSDKARRRFEREVELSATLEHPNIARVYEAGDQNGLFYYAMELIDGVPLDQYAQGRQPTVGGVLSLMQAVCRAVQHAHQRAVIHRDLKPSNILVSADGQPHVLDFGLAKTLLETDRDRMITQSGDLAGTLAYMSPEQAAGRIEQIDTRTDVYALGVILYRLLAARHPYPLGTLGLHEAVRVIQDVEPASLSTRDRSLRGDVETIVAKALAKEPGRRYASAQELADDIGRYLNHEPIEARPASTWYQVAKFAKRNRTLVGSAVLVFLALLFGVIGTSLALSRALNAEATALSAAKTERGLRKTLEANEKDLIEAKNAAERERASAEAVSAFLVDMFKQPDRRQTPVGGRRDVLVIDVLDTAAARLDKAFREQPLIEAALRHVFGVTYRNLGEVKKSVEQHERELDLRREHDDGQDPMAMATALFSSGFSLALLDRHEEVRSLYEAALELTRTHFGADHTSTLEIQAELANTLGALGQTREAEALLVSTLAKMRRVLGDRHLDTLQCLASLANHRQGQGRLEEAERLMREAYEGMSAVVGPDHPDTLACGYGLVGMRHRLGRLSEAHALAEPVWKTKARVLGESHPDALKSACNLAVVLHDLGRKDEALVVAERALRAVRQIREEDHRSTLIVRTTLASLLAEIGRTDDAIDQLLEVLSRQRRLLGEAHATTERTVKYLARLLPKQGREPELAALVLDMLEAQRRRQGDAHPDTTRVKIRVGVSLTSAKRPAEAEALLAETLAGLPESAYPPAHPLRLQARESLALALLAQAQADEAASILRETLDLRVKHLGPAAIPTANNYYQLARTLLKLGKHEQTVDLLFQSMRRWREPGPAATPALNDRLYAMYRAADGLRRQVVVGREQDGVKAAEVRVRRYADQSAADLGERHPATLVWRFILVLALSDLGRGEEAMALSIRTQRESRTTGLHASLLLSIAQTSLRKQSKDLKRKANELRVAGNLKAALPWYRQAFEASTAAVGHESVGTLDLYNWLGRTLTELGRHEEAIAVLDEAIKRQTAAGVKGKPYLEVARSWRRQALQARSDKHEGRCTGVIAER